MMSSTKFVDVIIVGSGPAGVSAAIELSRNSIEFIILEKNDSEHLGMKSCAGAISPKALRLYKYLGLSEQYFEREGRKENKAYLSGFNRTLQGYSNKNTYGYFINRKILDDEFRKLLRDNYDIVIKYGHKVSDFTIENKQISVNTVCNGSNVIYKCNYLIGADGSTSIIRKKASKNTIKDSDIIVTAENTVLYNYLDHPFVLFHDDAIPTYSWIFPYRSTQANIGIGIYRNVLKKKSSRNIHYKYMKRMFYNRDNIHLPKLNFWVINTNSFQKNIFSNRVVLIGDAGGYVDPITGEGIYYALKSGISAANAIKLALKKGSLYCNVYKYHMYSSTCRLRLSKSIQILINKLPFIAKFIFMLCPRSRILNNIVFRFFSNT